MSRYQYRVTKPILPPDATSPVMDYRQMEDWLNRQDEAGWELVTYGQTLWNAGVTQEWWIFRKLR